MVKSNRSHDISFLNTAGREVGLMLAEKNGYKNYVRYDDQTLANQFYTGQPDYGYLPPEKEIAIIQSNSEAGFGLEFADSNDDKRYYYSIGADNRFKNNTILGPLPVAIALPTTYTKSPPTITNGDFETGTFWETPTGWTFVTGGGADSAVKAGGGDQHSGTYFCLMIPAGADCSIYQDLAWNNELKGTPVRAEVWFSVLDHTMTRGQITIDDGVGTTTASLAASGSYTKVTVSRTLDANATRLRITITADYLTANASIRVDDCVVYVAHVAPPVDSVVMNDKLFLAMGSCIFSLNSTGDGFDYVCNVYYPITNLCEVHIVTAVQVTYLFISTGSSHTYWYYRDDTPFLTEGAGADPYSEFMVNVSGVYYKVTLPNTVKKTTNPLNSGVAWSAASIVGPYEEDITAVEVDVDIPYFGKEDTVYYLDTSDAAYPMIADMDSLRASTNCKNMLVWHKRLYVPAGNQGLVEYDNGTVTWRSPSLFVTNLNYFTGAVQALAADEEYLYAIVDNGTKIEIVAGQQRYVDGKYLWAWHPIQEVTLAGCQYAVVSNVYAKRLWLASTSSTDSIYYIPITTRYGDIANDSNYKYLTGGYDVTPWYHLNLKADDKAFLSMTLSTEGCDASNYVQVYYQTYYTALTGTWTLLGKFDSSPTKTISLSSSIPTGTMIRFKRIITTSSTSTSPRITGMDCRGIWRPEKRKMIQCAVIVKDNPVNRNGTKSDETEKSISTAIVEQNDRTAPTTFYDIDGTSHLASFISASKQNVKLTAEGNPEYEYVLLVELLT